MVKLSRCDGMVDVTDSKSVGGDTVWVRVPPPAPNKHDSFDTRVSETIVLFLFAKAPVTQGFSAQLPFELVSL